MYMSKWIQPAEVRLRKNIKGIDRKVPVSGRKKVRYIHFDNAASTPALETVFNEMSGFLDWYSGVHRGTGYKSQVSSRIYDDCHDVIGRFVGADLDRDSIIMVKNTTEAINKLSYRLKLQPSEAVITSEMEHHSNDLPWRGRARLLYIGLDSRGKLDIDDAVRCLKKKYPRTRLLTVCGASNVTGHVNHVHLLAEMAHEYGCRIMVDGAQLIPHQTFNMKPHSDPGHIDFLAFSGHKIFAPFGAGVLIGPREAFRDSAPEYSGGGTVKIVTHNNVYWAEPPDLDEAGSPNVIGTYSLARTLQYLNRLGMNKLQEHEEKLTAYLLEKIKAVPGITVYGDGKRVGVISFNLEGMPHALVGAILCYDAGIGTRTGCFCAQNYVRQLLGLEEKAEHLKLYEENRNDLIPGMVRVSLAAYNTREEVDHLLEWLHKIAKNRNEFKKKYRFAANSGSFIPVDYAAGKFVNNICNRHLPASIR